MHLVDAESDRLRRTRGRPSAGGTDRYSEDSEDERDDLSFELDDDIDAEYYSPARIVQVKADSHSA